MSKKRDWDVPGRDLLCVEREEQSGRVKHLEALLLDCRDCMGGAVQQMPAQSSSRGWMLEILGRIDEALRQAQQRDGM